MFCQTKPAGIAEENLSKDVLIQRPIHLNNCKYQPYSAMKSEVRSIALYSHPSFQCTNVEKSGKPQFCHGAKYVTKCLETHYNQGLCFLLKGILDIVDRKNDWDFDKVVIHYTDNNTV